jgi:hypothetical protein
MGRVAVSGETATAGKRCGDDAVQPDGSAARSPCQRPGSTGARRPSSLLEGNCRSSIRYRAAMRRMRRVHPRLSRLTTHGCPFSLTRQTRAYWRIGPRRNRHNTLRRSTAGSRFSGDASAQSCRFATRSLSSWPGWRFACACVLRGCRAPHGSQEQTHLLARESAPSHYCISPSLFLSPGFAGAGARS